MEDKDITQLGRRRFVSAGVAGAAMALSGASLAKTQAPAESSASGPKVFLDYTQEELDKAYDQANYAPNRVLVIKRWGTNSEVARSRLGEPERHAYGESEVEALDLFKTSNSSNGKAPIHIFLHGGAWRSGDAKTYAFIAEPFVARGAHCVIPDFTNVVESKGDLRPMADQVRRAIAWVYKNAESFGGDPDKIYLSGHSSGGHLAGVAVATDWEKDWGVPADIIKGAVLVSGMFDLQPVRLSSRSSYVNIDDEVEESLSSQRHMQHINAKLLIVYGDQETPEFMRQSRDFAEAAKKAGKDVEVVVGRNYNHFEIIETLANPFGIAGYPALQQMGI